MNKTYILLFVVLFMASCKSKKVVTKHKPKPKTDAIVVKPKTAEVTKKKKTVFEYQTDYIEKYKDIAMREMREYGIPASITLAQGILESGAGRSVLSKQSNNHFGIKCHKDWKGKSVNYDDDAPQECFRKYKNPEESFIDHSKFLTGKKRYAFLFDLPKNNYIKWAFGLKKAGYATDPKYPKKLINYIEKYNLYQYDNVVLGKKKKKKYKKPAAIVTVDDVPKNKPVEGVKTVIAKSENPKQSVSQETVSKPVKEIVATVINSTDNVEIVKSSNAAYHIVVAGDTFYSLSKKYNVSIESLKTLNNIEDNSLDIGQKLLIKKAKSVTKPYAKHLVVKGDTLYSLSKKYDVTVAYLKELNNLTSNDLPLGQELKY